MFVNDYSKAIALIDQNIASYEKCKKELESADLKADVIHNVFDSLAYSLGQVQSAVCKFMSKKKDYGAYLQYLADVKAIEIHNGEKFIDALAKYAEAYIKYKRATKPIERMTYCFDRKNNLLDDECDVWEDDTPDFLFSCLYQTVTRKKGNLRFRGCGISRYVDDVTQETYETDWNYVTPEKLAQAVVDSYGCFLECVESAATCVNDEDVIVLTGEPTRWEDERAFLNDLREHFEYVVTRDYDLQPNYAFAEEEEDEEED